MEYISHSESDTIDFAKNFAAKLDSNSVVVLTGDLGAGKTVFVLGILKHFNIENQLSSPTFTIVNQYDANQIIYHFDVYRLNGTADFIGIGGLEYFNNGICIIEWGEKIKDVLPKNTIFVKIEKLENDLDGRKIIIWSEKK